MGAVDMGGNVWEWVSDWYIVDFYEVSPVLNPAGPATGEFKVIRGGGWTNQLQYLRTTFRDDFSPERQFSNIGFRCARPSGQ